MNPIRESITVTRTHPGAVLYLYRDGKRVLSTALRWWELEALGVYRALTSGKP